MPCKHKAEILRLLNECNCGSAPAPPAPGPAPTPAGKTVRVKGNRLISPNGNNLYLRIGGWFNFLELDSHGKHTVTGPQIKAFMDYCMRKRINCVLFKAGYWLIKDDGLTMNEPAINFVNYMIAQARKRSIYVILNMFDTWNRKRGSRMFATRGHEQVFNVWSGHAEDIRKAINFVRMFTNEFKHWPNVIFELGNEIEHSNNGTQFVRIADKHLLPKFYEIAGEDRPIGCSQHYGWQTDVNVVFSHDPHWKMITGVRPNGRPVMLNELAAGSRMWMDENIRLHSWTKRYTDAFKIARRKGACGVCAASGIKLSRGYNTGAINKVLTSLGAH